MEQELDSDQSAGRGLDSRPDPRNTMLEFLLVFSPASQILSLHLAKPNTSVNF